MTAHVVLLRASPNLTAAERDAFIESFAQALAGIPTIRRSTVGRRISIGEEYEAAQEHYDYLAVLEFDSEADLRAYLAHPAHAALGAHFRAAAEAALVYDFAVAPGERLETIIAR